MGNPINFIKICNREEGTMRKLSSSIFSDCLYPHRWHGGAVGIFLWIGTMALPGQTQLPPNRPTFFEEGYRQMEQEIQQLEQRPTQPQQGLLTIETDELRWQQFLSREGGFSVWIPAGISTTETKTVTTTTSPITFEVLSTNQPDSRFIVAYGTVTTDTMAEQAEELFNQIRDFIIADTGFTVEAERPILYEQFPGRRLTLDAPEEQIILQMYWVGEQIYVLGMSQGQNVDFSKAANQFFDSFRVLP